MDLEEREREKQRLQKLLKDFAKEAVAGVAVSLVNPQTGRRFPYVFQMDRNLSMFSLRPKDGTAAESTVQDFAMKDITAFVKGQEVYCRAPTLGSDAATCVGFEAEQPERWVVLQFEDTYERDKFYTSMQVLRMSVCIATG